MGARVVNLRTEPAFFAFQGDWCLREGSGFGCTCARCKRAISAPHQFQGRVIWCIYCGLETGRLPAVEIEDWPGESPWGLTAAEAAGMRP